MKIDFNQFIKYRILSNTTTLYLKFKKLFREAYNSFFGHFDLIKKPNSSIFQKRIVFILSIANINFCFHSTKKYQRVKLKEMKLNEKLIKKIKKNQFHYF